jgi:pyrroline-5-carboxylate reductase
MGLKIALVGCGAMGSALLKGWLTLADSKARFKSFWVINPHREKVDPFLKDSRVRWFSNPSELPRSPDIILFAVKPNLLEDILPLYKSFESLFISVVTGKSLDFMVRHLFPAVPLVRAMPNTPVSIHQGIIGLLANAQVTDDQKNQVETCFKELGFCLWVKSDEDMNKLTAISGSGPGYIFYMIEAFAQGAESLGFDKETALSLALYTFWGASTYARHSFEENIPPEVLRQRVTSPQGTTIEALKVLEGGKFHHLMETAMMAAYTRAKEIANEG